MEIVLDIYEKKNNKRYIIFKDNEDKYYLVNVIAQEIAFEGCLSLIQILLKDLGDK